MAGTLILTQSRGGLAGALVGGLGMLALIGWWGRGIMLGALAAAGWGAWRIGLAPVADILTSRVELEASGTVYFVSRLELWWRAIYAMRDFPLTGMGLNVFRRAVHVLHPLYSAPVFVERDIAHAHNHLLQAALDLGIPGPIAYLSLWILSIYLSLAVWRKSADVRLRTVALGAFGSLLACFVYGLTDTVALGAKPGVAFWMLLGLVLSVHRLGAQGQSHCRATASRS